MIELLVVVSIVALLVSILLPSLGRARQQASRVQCLSQVRQIATGSQLYAGDHKEFLPWLSPDPNDIELYNDQGNQFALLRPYIPTRAVYTCPTAAGTDSSGSNWPTVYGATVDGVPFYTDYKITDYVPLVRRKVSAAPLPAWLILSIDLDWGATPRHNGGENMGFLDGHAKWLHRDHYKNEGDPGTYDPRGNTPWWRWGL